MCRELYMNEEQEQKSSCCCCKCLALNTQVWTVSQRCLCLQKRTLKTYRTYRSVFSGFRSTRLFFFFFKSVKIHFYINRIVSRKKNIYWIGFYKQSWNKLRTLVTRSQKGRRMEKHSDMHCPGSYTTEYQIAYSQKVIWNDQRPA